MPVAHHRDAVEPELLDRLDDVEDGIVDRHRILVLVGPVAARMSGRDDAVARGKTAMELLPLVRRAVDVDEVMKVENWRTLADFSEGHLAPAGQGDQRGRHATSVSASSGYCRANSLADSARR